MDRLYSFKDNCGFGLLANLKNEPSYQNTSDAITALERMMHRGAIASDGKSGDGCGLLFSLPTDFMRKMAKQNGVDLPEQFAVAMVFLKTDEHIAKFEELCLKNDLKVVLNREVPVDTDALGELALETLPRIVQFFITPNTIIAKKYFESLLYLARREIQRELKEDDDFYICSFSNKVIVYKGLIMPTYIKTFFKDLKDKDFATSFALFHQRFSTNTLPKWRLAQPFRTIAHNGEINSISANRTNLKIQEKCLKSHKYTGDELKSLLPITDSNRSDSASLDNFFEFLIENEVDFFKAVRLTIPAPWQNSPYTDAKIRSFYEYTSPNFSPWDGPAAISFTNGRFIACCLDRNGLRPAKFIITKDDRVLISSEYGVLDIAESEIKERGRLQSGQMIGLDLKYGKIMKNDEINDYIKNTADYTKWLNENMIHLEEFVELPFEKYEDYKLSNLHALQRNFSITNEFKEMILTPMLSGGKEATGSMGDDTSLAAFSDGQRRFSDFFKQKFAQVTNPPIDPLREMVVMSLNITFGEYRNFLSETEAHAKRIKTISPILMQEKFDVLKSFGDEHSPRYQDEFKNATFSTLFSENLKGSLEDLAYDVINAVKNGVHIVLLDDRGVDEKTAAIPMAMAVGRVHQALIEEGLRYKVSIIAVSGEVLDSHSVALMIGYGASAVYPYLLFASGYELLEGKDETSVKVGLKNIHHALNAGLLKTMSKMGIATVGSYKNSALFDILGLSKNITNECFSSSEVLIPGLEYSDIEARVLKAHKNAFNFGEHLIPLNLGGYYKYLDKEEFHDYTPFLINQIHKTSITANMNDFALIRDAIKGRGQRMVRDFLSIKSDREPISLDEVEPVSAILKRFNSAAMSLGSISPEAHETLALAMNKLGAMSNSGEGGEADERLKSPANSQIKQIASGRFGVTPEYLASASEIQIKLAQGAKPGEGGQLPGYKVTGLIATLRYTTPGVTLISPPPHHDIYSIEDLAQLIFDLKQINPRATIAVKLVSSAGVGTIAAGVAKCYADKIVISGGDGGTGAANWTSIKFTGNPWELGLIEAHNALKVNNLRSSVHLQTDGGLKIGEDIIKAALLGAESYAFGTLALVILGCKVLKICHLNRCTEGVATQDPALRDKFVGSVDRVVNYFTLLAEDVRLELAKMGYKSMDEIIGRNDLFEPVESKFDLSELTRVIPGASKHCGKPNEPFDKNEFEKGVLKEVYKTIQNPERKIVIDKQICNQNRSFGTLISGEIAKFYGNKGFESQTIRINLTGIAGQSLGAFLSSGMALYLKGSANDYVGKGMNGGRIVISPEDKDNYFAVAGNTCLYGATGGKLFASGIVGERFCVRNSGATAVVEGVGDHACEYMTGGVVAILGATGINFGAGMTGGIAFVWDERREFIDKLNQELVIALRIDTDEMDEVRHFLKRLLTTYYNETKSVRAKHILDNFRDSIREFWMVKPKDMTKLPLNPADGD
ncbi:glutamate synthase, large subunit [Campylobacter iguaniorum]|uniref:Glutamate synthase, large subunit n=1 Tax=Campylobacter iguaniorum TaxID=1244531 RepID=A0A076F7M2_9BACT|nr:glutamate synthase large subunit [Campylobacter iguaniorum]AII14250.1 glutamate synthase, large subunit [Campylobacter iguaniorum]ALV23988.1 glutamate synthase, large subunit [Campylobacter iguaniorum]